MSFRRTAALLLRQFYLLRGSPARVVPLFSWVAIDIVLWGFITRYLNAVSGARFNFVPAMLGAVLLWDFMARVLQGITTAFLEDVWSRNFLNLFASPLSVSEYLSGLVLSSIATSLVGLTVMVLLATAVFGLSFFIYGSMLAALILVLFLFGISLGIFGSALVLRFGPAAEWFIWPIPAFISPLACVFYPLSTLPRWMQYLAHLIPASYVFEGMRQVLANRAGHGPAVSAAPLAFGSALALVYLLGMARMFTGVYRHAVRTGLIARYSAETVS
ncbi:MAG TPA: ABC transporter permease [Acidobacteriaceae bacterium]|jgi:ABC-2 type transport system permease protein|nr:ABC transporter permease [Acidobacteriaceae bacterium]